MSVPRHIALIGCGFSGTSAFFQLVDACPVSRITIFETSGEFAPGYPYRRDECEDYLINNTTDTMCLVPSNRRAFVDWLKMHPEIVPDLDEKGHLPRRIYGAFLADVDMRDFRARGARNIYLANMMLWGPGFFTTSAFMMATIVERVLKAAFGDTKKRST